jgi:dipeptidyl aminopeptidase/acylaminoacyl peptidase
MLFLLWWGTTEPNDNFISQLVDNAEAAINAVDALGYIDKNKVAVGGHSYGAFMTANLLTHSNLLLVELPAVAPTIER